MDLEAFGKLGQRCGHCGVEHRSAAEAEGELSRCSSLAVLVKSTDNSHKERSSPKNTTGTDCVHIYHHQFETKRLDQCLYLCKSRALHNELPNVQKKTRTCTYVM